MLVYRIINRGIGSAGPAIEPYWITGAEPLYMDFTRYREGRGKGRTSAKKGLGLSLASGNALAQRGVEFYALCNTKGVPLVCLRKTMRSGLLFFKVLYLKSR